MKFVELKNLLNESGGAHGQGTSEYVLIPKQADNELILELFGT